jgi:hypothetical protein
LTIADGIFTINCKKTSVNMAQKLLLKNITNW